jgi:hypothetical protein
MLLVLAEYELELIIDNTRDGLAAARARGRVGGLKPRLSADQAELAQQLYDAGTKTVAQIADMFGLPAPPSTATSTGWPSVHVPGADSRKLPVQALSGWP